MLYACSNLLRPVLTTSLSADGRPEKTHGSAQTLKLNQSTGVFIVRCVCASGVTNGSAGWDERLSTWFIPLNLPITIHYINLPPEYHRRLTPRGTLWSRDSFKCWYLFAGNNFHCQAGTIYFQFSANSTTNHKASKF